jgi:hypothetical protein
MNNKNDSKSPGRFRSKEEWEEYKNKLIADVEAKKEKPKTADKKDPAPIIAPTEKRCRHCAMMIPKEAKICPLCRKRQGVSSPLALFLILIAGLCIIGLIIGQYSSSVPAGKKGGVSDTFKGKTTIPFSVTLDAYPDNPNEQVPFKVVWKSGIFLGSVVSEDATTEQLTDLISKFQEARKNKSLSSLIPPINLGLKDKYVFFTILFFKDSTWASLELNAKYVKSGMESEFAKSYVNHIVASYTLETDKEYGDLGYDDGVIKSEHYKKLFKESIPNP